ncbi:hypothetical protein D9M68_830120 [compost metagenome]
MNLQFAVDQQGTGVPRHALGRLRRAQQLRTAQQRLDARQQLGDGKGFGEVVVGPEFQTQHAVEFGGFGRQHQDGGVVAARAQGLAHLQPVQSRHHQVEHQQVVPDFGLQRQRRRSIAGLAHAVAGAAQVQRQQIPDIGLVLGNQDLLHGVHGNGSAV